VHEWTRRELRDPQVPPPRYLFLSTGRNHRAQHPYPKTTLGRRLQTLAQRMDIRDGQGRSVRLSHVHCFRHTRATSLLNADARDLQIDPRDLYNALELDKRTDRVLPNGLCMLPPRQACNRGNACLTCDKFATDASYLPEHRQQLAKLDALIDQRKQAFQAKTGQKMSDRNVWLEQRLTERRALTRIIDVLDSDDLTDGASGVQGAGTTARPAQPREEA
jgi:hypothetical protein